MYNLLTNITQKLQSNRVYNWLTTSCMVIAIASAIAFDMTSSYDLMLGTLGCLAGIGALTIYLFRHKYFG